MFLILWEVGVERKYPPKAHLPCIGYGPLRCHKLVYGLTYLLLVTQPQGYYYRIMCSVVWRGINQDFDSSFGDFSIYNC